MFKGIALLASSTYKVVILHFKMMPFNFKKFEHKGMKCLYLKIKVENMHEKKIAFTRILLNLTPELYLLLGKRLSEIFNSKVKT